MNFFRNSREATFPKREKVELINDSGRRLARLKNLGFESAFDQPNHKTLHHTLQAHMAVGEAEAVVPF